MYAPSRSEGAFEVLTPGDGEECKIRLYGGEEILIRENYDDMSQFITSLEHMKRDDDYDEEDLIKAEIV